MRYEEISELFELRGDELWRKACIGPTGRRMKEKIVNLTGVNGRGYVTVKVNGKNEAYHRVIWCITNKANIPHRMQIDHEDGDKLNNSPGNLRLVTQRENLQNQHFHRSGKLVGAIFSKQKNKWTAQIEINDKNIYLGLYDTELEAHQIYMKTLAMVKALPTVFTRDIPAGLLRSVVRNDTGLAKLF